jgi:cobalt-zinc-cadmium efflux system protein
MILWSSLDIIKEAAGIFMEQVPRGLDADQVAETISHVPGVRNVHHLHIWTISSRAVALSCHITLSEADAPRYAAIIRAVNDVLLAEYGIGHATIQPEGDLCPEQPLIFPISRVKPENQ